MFIKQCPINPNDYEVKLNEAFLLLKKDLDALMILAVKYDSLGKSDLAKAAFDKLNNYHYLVYYFTLIKFSIAQAVENGEVTVWATYNEKYSIDCIRKKMACLGIDIDPILDIFFPGHNNTGGISVMRIGPDPNEVPFTVHPEN